jgi:hypothetical protein
MWLMAGGGIAVIVGGIWLSKISGGYRTDADLLTFVYLLISLGGLSFSCGFIMWVAGVCTSRIVAAVMGQDTEELPRYRHQVVERQQKVLPQIDGNGLLGAVHRRSRMMRRMRTIHRALAMLLLAHRATPNTVPSRQGADAFRACR